MEWWGVPQECHEVAGSAANLLGVPRICKSVSQECADLRGVPWEWFVKISLEVNHLSLLRIVHRLRPAGSTSPPPRL